MKLLRSITLEELPYLEKQLRFLEEYLPGRECTELEEEHRQLLEMKYEALKTLVLILQVMKKTGY